MGNALVKNGVFLDDKTVFGKTINDILREIPENKVRACCFQVFRGEYR